MQNENGMKKLCNEKFCKYSERENCMLFFLLSFCFSTKIGKNDDDDDDEDTQRAELCIQCFTTPN